MNLDDQTYDAIERYLGDLMTPEEKLAFEKRMAEDRELADQVEIFRLMPGYLSDEAFPSTPFESDNTQAKAYLDEFMKEEHRALKEHLDNKSNEQQSAEKRNTLSMVHVMRIAAVVVVLLGTAIFLMRPSADQRLYSKYAEHDDLSLNVRGESHALAQQAEALFNTGEYEEAMPLLEQMNAGQEVNYDLLLALGISYLESGEHTQALETFQSIYDSDALVRPDALFYNALSHVRSGDHTSARRALKQLQDEFADFQPDKVQSLLNDLQ